MTARVFLTLLSVGGHRRVLGEGQRGGNGGGGGGGEKAIID